MYFEKIIIDNKVMIKYYYTSSEFQALNLKYSTICELCCFYKLLEKGPCKQRGLCFGAYFIYDPIDALLRALQEEVIE